MTVNGIVAVILRNFTEFCRFGDQLHHSGWTYDRPTFCNRNV